MAEAGGQLFEGLARIVGGPLAFTVAPIGLALVVGVWVSFALPPWDVDPTLGIVVAAVVSAVATAWGIGNLRDITLRVASGETVALVGESGCGKTTLLRLFNRMVEPSRGEVRIGGPAATPATSSRKAACCRTGP